MRAGDQVRSGPRAWQFVLLAAAVLLVIVVGGLVVIRSTPPKSGPPPLAVFVGDSYTAGTGASRPGAGGWASVVARHEHWRVRNLALGGTGYLATSAGPGCGRASCSAFGGALPEVRRLRPAIVVVAGGRNDTTHDPAEVAAAIRAFFPSLRKAAPRARILVVPPLWDASEPVPEVATIAAEVTAAATAIDAEVLSVGQPLRGRADLLASDGLHPNDAGHRAIADAVERALRRSDA